MNRSRPPTRSFVTIPTPTTAPPTWTPDESLPLPSALDMDAYRLPAVDQGSRGGTCVCHAVTYHLDALRRFLGYSDVGRLSRLFCNYVAADAERQKRPDKSWREGIAVEDAFAGMVSQGVPAESWWPYNLGREYDKPPMLAYLMAKFCRITGYASLSATARNPVADKWGPAGSHYDLRLLKRAIQQRGSFPFAFSITGEGLNLVNGLLVPGPGPAAPDSEGHCVLANAYDDSREVFWFVNSYGSDARGMVRYSDMLRPDWAYSMVVATGINGRR